MTPVLPLVAKLGNAWILTLHQLKTLKTDKEIKTKKSGGRGGGGDEKTHKLARQR